MDEEQVPAQEEQAAMDPLAGLSPQAMMAEARKFVDPGTKFFKAAAGAMTPGPFSAGYGGAMAGYADGKAAEEQLVRQYLPVVQQAALAKQQRETALKQQWRQTIDTSMASLLASPSFSPELVAQTAQSLVTQQRVPPQMMEQYMRSLPNDPEMLRGYITNQALAATDPYRAVKPPSVEKYGEGEVGFERDPVTGERKQVASGAPKRTDIAKLLDEMMALPADDPRVNYYRDAINKASTHPPAANMTVNAEKPLVNNFMEALGTSAGAARDSALAARESHASASRLYDALNSGKVIAGPGAEAEVLLRQIGQYAGYGGANNAELLANTRNAIQSMAQLELNAAAQMKGQGAITDAERKLLEKAASGKITLTLPELRTLAQISMRQAQRRIKNYNDYAKKLQQVPGLQKVAPLLEVDEPAAPERLIFDAQGNPVQQPSR